MRNLLRGVAHVPDETLSEIFLLALPNPADPYKPPESNEEDQFLCVVQRVVSNVSRNWRRVSLSTPRLWACWRVYFVQPTDRAIRMAERYVEEGIRRSGDRPLTIDIRMNSDIDGRCRNLIRFVLSVRSRWETVHFECPGSIKPFRQLTASHLAMAPLDELTLKILNNLSWADVTGSFALSRLQTLVLEYLPSTFCDRLVRSSPNLLHLSILRCFDYGRVYQRREGPPIHFKNLRRLHVDTHPFLETLTCPSLQHFEYTANNSQDAVPLFLSFVTNNRFHLLSLTASAEAVSSRAFLPVFTLLPSLVTLRIERLIDAQTMEALADWTESGCCKLFPFLQELVLHIGDEAVLIRLSIPDAFWIRLVESRWKAQQRTIKTIRWDGVLKLDYRREDDPSSLLGPWSVIGSCVEDGLVFESRA